MQCRSATVASPRPPRPRRNIAPVAWMHAHHRARAPRRQLASSAARRPAGEGCKRAGRASWERECGRQLQLPCAWTCQVLEAGRFRCASARPHLDRLSQQSMSSLEGLRVHRTPKVLQRRVAGAVQLEWRGGATHGERERVCGLRGCIRAHAHGPCARGKRKHAVDGATFLERMGESARRTSRV